MFPIILLCISLFSIVSSLDIKPKFCKNCKYFLPGIEDKFGKCFMFRQKEIDYFIVNGINEVLDLVDYSNYYYCVTARSNEDLCGKNAKKYKRKYIKKN